MSKSLYLINPKADFPTYFSAESYAGRGRKPATLIADLALPTLAALAPNDFAVSLCDENITPVDLDHQADFVGITGKINQWGGMLRIAREFRERGKTVIIGGPFASLSPDRVGDHCDILVRGEVENIAPRLFSDLGQGSWREEYVGDQPDLSSSPRPRWDLYPNSRAIAGTVQTSRGCPFECEFCDVIQYLGRKQRHKPVGQVIAEVDEVYRQGYRTIFLADDNFTVYRSRAKELLEALRDWNLSRESGSVYFMTQVSIDAARDPELLQMCAEAGLCNVFIGIETPNEASLKETKKRQNLKIDLVERIQRFRNYGIAVMGGMIVGFDADGPDIFDRQFRFAMESGIPIFSLGALVAPAATPLHERMEREGRLEKDGSEVAALPWSTNIIPKGMTRDQLFSGIRWLCNNLYSPAAFEERLVSFVDSLGRRRDPVALKEGKWKASGTRRVLTDGLRLIGKLGTYGWRDTKMLSRAALKVLGRPDSRDYVLQALLLYSQARYMYEKGHFWETQLQATTPPH